MNCCLRKGEKNHLEIIIFVIFSLVALLFSSMCSPLFPLHNRVDQNVFFTVGREMLEGKVVYRDLFEHKGPITYFIHVIGALISSQTFVGIYLIEVLALVVFMIFAYKTAKLFVSDVLSFTATILTVTVMLCSKCFLRGDNVEELCMPLIMISMYYYLKGFALKNNPVPIKQTVLISFVNGILFAVLFWTKFTLVGYWIGWVLVTFIPLLYRKEVKEFFKMGFAFVGGILVVTIPIFIYFWAVGAVGDLFYTYFYCNIFLYESDTTFLERIMSILIGVSRNFEENPLLLSVTVYGLARLCMRKIFFPVISFLTLYAGIFFGGRWYSYYYLILAFYALFGFIDIWHLLEKIKNIHVVLKHKKKIFALISPVSLVVIVFFNNNVPFYGLEKEDYAQYQFAEYIESSGIEDPTLLNYGFIDQGFYLAADISPINKFFSRVNFSYDAFPEMYDEQRDLIDNKKVDFVVVRIGAKKSIEDDYYTYMTSDGGKVYIQNPAYVVPEEEFPLLFENYELVMEWCDPHDNYKFGLFEVIR